MNRRGFLQAILASGVAPAFVRAASLMPVSAVIGGSDLLVPAGNSLLTIDMITREALRVLHENMKFVGTINRQFVDDFEAIGSIRIVRPVRFHAAA